VVRRSLSLQRLMKQFCDSSDPPSMRACGCQTRLWTDGRTEENLRDRPWKLTMRTREAIAQIGVGISPQPAFCRA